MNLRNTHMSQSTRAHDSKVSTSKCLEMTWEEVFLIFIIDSDVILNIESKFEPNSKVNQQQYINENWWGIFN
jgi:hypothetical protein